MYLDTGLQFRAHKNLSLEKARKAESRLRRLGSTNELAPGLIRRIQVTAVQVMALYGAELWWCRQKRWCENYQKLINIEGRAVTVLLQSATSGVVVQEAGLWPAVSLPINR